LHTCRPSLSSMHALRRICNAHSHENPRKGNNTVPFRPFVHAMLHVTQMFTGQMVHGGIVTRYTGCVCSQRHWPSVILVKLIFFIAETLTRARGITSVQFFPMYSCEQSPVYTCSPHWHMMAPPNNGPKQDVVCLASVMPSKCYGAPQNGYLTVCDGNF
jgi:hypothetical protein